MNPTTNIKFKPVPFKLKPVPLKYLDSGEYFYCMLKSNQSFIPISST